MIYLSQKVEQFIYLIMLNFVIQTINGIFYSKEVLIETDIVRYSKYKNFKNSTLGFDILSINKSSIIVFDNVT